MKLNDFDIERGRHEDGINRVHDNVLGLVLDVRDDHVGIINHHGPVAQNRDGDVLTLFTIVF